MRLSRLIFVLPLLLAPLAFADDKPAPAPAAQKVNADKFDEIARQDGVILLDVRTPEEFKRRHLKGATLLPIQSANFDDQVAKLDKTKTYAVYCAMGPRSTRACDKLAKAGFTKLYNLDGGILAWEKANKSVERDPDQK